MKQNTYFNIYIISILLLVWTPLCQAEDKRIDGVWKGKIGNIPVTACFNGNIRSYYYYQKHLIPIPLDPDESSISQGSAMHWAEADGNWKFNTLSPDEISGIWTGNNQRKLPIALKRIATSNHEQVTQPDNIACGSDAFNMPLEKSKSLTIGETRAAGNLRYRYKYLYLDEAIFGTREGRPTTLIESGGTTSYHVSTIEFIGNDAATTILNNTVMKLIPREDDLINNMFGHRRDAMEHAMEGGYTYNVTLSSINHWLTLVIHETEVSIDRPISTSESKYIFDMNTGLPLNPIAWFKGGEKMEISNPTTLPPSLAKLVFSNVGTGSPGEHLDQNEFNDCYNSPAPGQVQYNLVLTKNSIVFEVPSNRNGSCGDAFEIPFSKLTPYLNKKGKAALSGKQ